MIFTDVAELERLEEANDLAGVESMIRSVDHRPPHGGALRSALMVSAHRVRHLNKLDSLQAHVAVINLEDGVAPEKKGIARALAALFLSRLGSDSSRPGPRLVVRVNPLGEGGEEDIALMNRVRPHSVRIPKIRSEQEVRRALELADPSLQVDLSIETAEAFSRMDRLRVDKRVHSFYLGILDLFASMGFSQSLLKRDNPTVAYILSRFLVESRAAGAHPFSFVYQDHRDEEGFESWCRMVRDMGYESTGCISPGQVSVANRIFVPDEADLVKARYVKDRFEEMRSGGVTGFVDERYGFIDEPIYRDAMNLLSRVGGDDD